MLYFYPRNRFRDEMKGYSGLEMGAFDLFANIDGKGKGRKQGKKAWGGRRGGSKDDVSG